MAPQTYFAKHTATNTVTPSTYTPPNGAATTVNGQTVWTSFNPPTPAPPAPTPVFDPNLDPGYAATSNAQTNINTHAQGEHDYSYGNIAQTSGYDSKGQLITDPNSPDYNPYAAAAVLKKHYDDSVRGTTNSYASQGQLYSGALNNAQNTNTYNYGLSSDQLQRTTANQYHGADSTLQGTLDQGSLSLAQLLGPTFQNWLASQRGS